MAAFDAMALDRAFPETKGEKLATLSAFCASNATQAAADDSVTDDACMSALAFCSRRAGQQHRQLHHEPGMTHQTALHTGVRESNWHVQRMPA